MKKIIRTDKGPRPIGPYSQAVVADGVVFVSDEVLGELLSAAAAIADTTRGRAEAVRGGVGLRSQLWLDDFLLSRSEGRPLEGQLRLGPAKVSDGARRGRAHG
jgi:hypothetical protein